MKDSGIIHVKKASMRRWIAITVLATQMLAGVCVIDAGIKSANACCHDCGVAVSAQSCNCCRLDSPSMPSLAAVAPFAVAPPTIITAPASGIEVPTLPALGSRVFRSDLPAAALSPPRLYLHNATFLI